MSQAEEYAKKMKGLNLQMAEDARKLQEEIATWDRDRENKVLRPSGLSGWVCPVCGAGLSPFTAVCPCKPMPAPKITC
jgi:hypothetical protein